MFAHPGISALEFAGAHEKAVMGKAPSLRVETTTSPTPNRDSVRSADASTAELESLRPSSQEANSQRRRGTFINHTPRDFEMRSPMRSEFPRGSEDDQSTRHGSRRGSTGDNTRRPSLGNSRPSSSSPWAAGESVKGNPDASVELGSRIVGAGSTHKVKWCSPPTSYRNSAGISLAGTMVRRSSVGMPTADGTQHVHLVGSAGRRQADRKRKRHKTPTPRAARSARHSPLEPWVARHRRQGTGSTVGDPPPRVEIEDVAEVATFRAIQEYLDSQRGTLFTEFERNEGNRQRSPSPTNIPLPISPERSSSPAEHSISDFAGDVDASQDATPKIPDRNPKRLHLHSTSGVSMSSDSGSAGDGQCPTCEKEPDVLRTSKRRGQGREEKASRNGSSILGRMAPPILGHAALTASADLNDLSFYLKNTGPSPEPTQRPRKKLGFRMFKPLGKKKLAQRVGSVEGFPQPAKPRQVMPACAREMTTSSGTKHLRIIIPTDTLCNDQSITLPVEGSGSKHRSQHVSITWTDEMPSPLASPALEDAISGFNSTEAAPPLAPVVPQRSPKRSPVSLQYTPVEKHDHPLATREEQTRARKLRDLKRARSKEISGEEKDTIAGMSSIIKPGSTMVDMEGEYNNERPGDTLSCLKNKVIFLQRRNTELVEALAKVVGLELADGDLESEDVLRAYRQMRFSETPS